MTASRPEIQAVYLAARAVRDIIALKVPPNSVVPEHTFDSHHYRCHVFDGSPLYDSVTTKTGVLSGGMNIIKKWAVRTAVDYVRDHISSTAPEDMYQMLGNAQDEPERIFNQAGVDGTIVHEAVEEYLRTWIDIEERPQKQIKDNLRGTYHEVLAGAIAAQRFLDEHWIVPVIPEFLVASQRLQVAGTLDLLAFVGTETKPASRNHDMPRDYFQTKMGNDPRVVYVECANTGHQVRFDLTIVDWKTSSSIEKAAYLLQVTAYREALEELTGLRVNNAVIVQLSKKDGKYAKALIGARQIQKAASQYRNVSDMYDWLKSADSNIQLSKPEVITLKI